MDVHDFVQQKNDKKYIFTAGPASLLNENIEGLEPCFGRGDPSYDRIESDVLSDLKELSGHREVARFQSSGSGALEIMITNFCFGRVLVVDTGYYSQRASDMAKVAKEIFGYVRRVDVISWQHLSDVSEKYDWIIACYTETSIGLKLDISNLNSLKAKTGAKLMLDATASIGLEDGHNLADVISYSSCKGLFGLTGAGFVAFNQKPENEIASFNLSIDNHINKKMTGPYHAICSIHQVLKNYSSFRKAVLNTKREFCAQYEAELVFPSEMQPLLCTLVKVEITSTAAEAVLYEPRTISPGHSVVCHLGEVHLKDQARGDINKHLTRK